jgi:plasmid stabilization system protein ParE
MTLKVVWSAQARSQLIATLTYIAKDDPHSAALVVKRVEKSLRLLADSPDMGVPAPVSGVRTYAVPNTGHSFDYRTIRQEIRIQRWYRQRQQPRISN